MQDLPATQTRNMVHPLVQARTLFAAALVCAAALCTLPAMAATAAVQFENPDHFTDIGPRRDADTIQQQLRQIIEALAAERLPASQTLRLTIIDIDLAGEIEPATRPLHDVRVMGNRPDWPRITLRFSLQEGNRVLAQGNEVVTDMAYLQRGTRQGDHHRLPYEQRMLSDWFDRRFTQPAGR